MGGSSFSYDDYVTTSSTYKSKSTSQIFTTNKFKDEVNPAKMKGGLRESCDSDANPNSTPIIIGLDFTGSMRNIPSYMMKEGLGELFKEIYDRKPVSDPQVLFCGIGDAMVHDPAPFQVSQFESECGRLISGLENFWLDGCRGGGNSMESYDLPYYFAANYTKTDAFMKRGQKGFIFTIGDEPPPEVLSPAIIKDVFDSGSESTLTFAQIIKQAQRTYIPFHIVIEEGSHPNHYGLDSVLKPWQELLGENVIVCSDYTKLSEIIVSILQVKSGANKEDVIKSWDGSTSVAVQKAISSLTTAEDNGLIF